jgi:N-acetylmuramic acid 6-phosphate etherase
MAVGCSYFGNRILRHVAADMEGLAAAGFTGVLHTMSENDVAYYRDTLGRMVALSHQAGLEVQVGPWGLGRVFGGEAETHFVAVHPELGQVLDDGQRVAAGCLNQEGFRAFVRDWASAAVETGADRVFWDEPHWAHPSYWGAAPQRWGCRCEVCRTRYREWSGGDMPGELTPEVVAFRDAGLVEFIGDVVAHVAGLGGRSTVCVLPDTIADWSAVARLPGLDTLATDPYWQLGGHPVVAYVGGYARRVVRDAAEAGVGAQLWIQGYRLGPEDEADIRAAVDTARAAGIEDLWTWGYEACGHMSYLGTREPERVWAILTDALTGRPPEDAFLRNTVRSGGTPVAELGDLVTEGRRAELADLDLRPTEDLVRLMAAEERAVAAAVERAAPVLAAAVDAIAERLGRGGRLIYVGAGTAGRLGVLDAAECGPTFGAGEVVLALLAGGPEAVTRPQEGAEDDGAQARADLDALGIGAGDAVVGISASGRTPYAIAAVRAARERGALTVGVSCQPSSELSAAAEHPVEVVVGPEIIAGSTRLKAGSAQKLVLNTISTAVMVRLGRTFGNLMTGVSGGSEKLADRARRIVAQATGLPPGEAAAALEAAGGEVPTAIVAALAGVEVAEARRRLAAAGGSVRRALAPGALGDAPSPGALGDAPSPGPA